MWFDKISDHKHDICLCGKLSTKLLAEAANKNTKLMFAKTGRPFFGRSKYGFRSNGPAKFQTNTSVG